MQLLEEDTRNVSAGQRGESGKERVFIQIVGRKLLPKIANTAWNAGPIFSRPRNR